MKLFKILFYTVFILIAAFLFWFLPKYSFVHKNPQYCVNLTKNLYYCGTNAKLEDFYGLFEKK